MHLPMAIRLPIAGRCIYSWRLEFLNFGMVWSRLSIAPTDPLRIHVQVVRAYEILSDETRRADYDRHGHRGQNMEDEVRHVYSTRSSAPKSDSCAPSETSTFGSSEFDLSSDFRGFMSASGVF